MLTLEQILEIVHQNKKPYLYLQIKKGIYQAPNAGSYECENCKENDSIEEKTELAAKWLAEYVKQFPPGSVFLLTMKSAVRANGNGITGPLEFQTEPEEKAENKTNIQGLNGYDFYEKIKSLGYVPESEIKAQIAEKELEFERERQKREFEDLKRQFETTLQEQQEAAATWSPDSLNKLAVNIAGIIGLVTGKTNGLAGAEPEETEKPDPKATVINSFAESLYDNLSLKEIEQLKNIVNKQIQSKKNKQTEQNTTA